MLSIIGALVASQVFSLPAGAYMPDDLCRQLTQSTGANHRCDKELSDYPVFLSIKNPTPARVEELVSGALQAKWIKTENGLELAPAPPNPEEDLPQFQDQINRMVTKPVFKDLPARILHDMPYGSIVRFGQHPGPHVLPLPLSMAKVPTIAEVMLKNSAADPVGLKYARDHIKSMPNSAAGGFWRVKRKAYGDFVFLSSGFSIPQGELFDWGTELQFSALPKPVADLLHADLAKVAPRELPPHLPGNTDLMVFWANPDLKGLGSVVSTDLAIALPDAAISDLSFYNLTRITGTSVRDLLAALSNADEWTVFDGAAVAKIPACEALHRTQARREALAKYVEASSNRNFASLPDFKNYFSAQRPEAVTAWWELTLLGQVHLNPNFDLPYSVDWPYNIRFALDLTPQDWALMQQGKAFPLSSLSAGAASQILTLLLDSQARVNGDEAIDPATWPSLAPNALTVTPKFTQAPILLQWDQGRGIVTTPIGAGWNYAFKQAAEHPLFQTATYQKLSFRISNPAGQFVESGFSQTLFDSTVKPFEWSALPAPMLAEFNKGVKAAATGKAPPGLAPPTG